MSFYQYRFENTCLNGSACGMGSSAMSAAPAASAQYALSRPGRTLVNKLAIMGSSGSCVGCNGPMQGHAVPCFAAGAQPVRCAAHRKQGHIHHDTRLFPLQPASEV